MWIVRFTVEVFDTGNLEAFFDHTVGGAEVLVDCLSSDGPAISFFRASALVLQVV